MRKGTVEYELASGAVVEVLRTRVRQRAAPLQYGRLSTALARLGHHVPPCDGPMRTSWRTPPSRESPDGSLPLLWALVVLKETRMPSGGFFKLTRRAPYQRPGDDTELWIKELKDLARHYVSR